MIRKLLSGPLKIVKRILGREEAAKAPPPVRRAPPPRPTAPEAPRDHGHSHDHGGGHDHGHDHGDAREPAAKPVPAPVPAASHDHGHDHGGGQANGAAAGANIRIDESETPNPNARKFTASVTVIEKGSLSFNEAEEAASHPVSRYIWGLGGVKGIFAVKDFVTVTKTAEADWAVLSPKIPAALRRGLVERDGA